METCLLNALESLVNVDDFHSACSIEFENYARNIFFFEIHNISICREENGNKATSEGVIKCVSHPYDAVTHSIYKNSFIHSLLCDICVVHNLLHAAEERIDWKYFEIVEDL